MIDWGRVATLRSEIGAEDFEEVASLFLEEAEEVIGRLRDGRIETRLVDELHALKGSALNLGFGDLAAMLQEKERRVARGEPISTERIVDCYNASSAAFAAGIARLNSAA